MYLTVYLFLQTKRLVNHLGCTYVKVSLDYRCNNEENYGVLLDHLSIDSQTDSLIQMLRAR